MRYRPYPYCAVTALLLAWCASGQVRAGTTAGIDAGYDSNPFERTSDRRGAPVTSIRVASSGLFRVGSTAHIRIAHEAGIRRLWREPERIEGGTGDVLINRVTLSGRNSFGRLAVLAAGAAKFKTATRHPGEESYLRGEGSLRIGTTPTIGLSAGAGIRFSDEDSRDILLPEVSLRSLNAGVGYRFDGRTRLRAVYTRSRRRYDRQALTGSPGGTIVPGLSAQSDLLRVFDVSLDFYRNGLFQAHYGYLSNASNSFGYDYRSHRVRLQAALSLFERVDGLFVALRQFRHYSDPLLAPPAAGTEADEYEQTTLAIKLRRPFDAGFAAGLRYTYLRNGASGATYSKHAIGFFIEISAPYAQPQRTSAAALSSDS